MRARSGQLPEKAVAHSQSTFGQTRVNTLARIDRLYVAKPQLWVVIFTIAYVVAAYSYATLTPAWQVPDEPAHYNYIAYIAEQGSLPVLRMGDYDQSLIERLLSTGFAPMIPTSTLRYESYQPPLYYLTAVPIYWFTGGSLHALRLYNVFLGFFSILILYRCVALVFPLKTMLSVGAIAFAATLPMYVAMTAAVNNDGLAVLLILASTLVLLQWMRDQFYDISSLESSRQTQRLVVLGLLLGLGLLTKIYAYALLPICLTVVILVGWVQPRVGSKVQRRPWQEIGWAIRRSLWTAVPALLLGLPFWLRNMSLYGVRDLLGLTWHDIVVVGQPRTGEWIALHGWVAYSERAMQFTFQSFWGVFGWMGVFMDQRIYLAMLVFTGIIFVGVLWAVVRLISGPPDTDMDGYQISVLLLFVVLLVAVLTSYVSYNVKFVQHQGRYLFWGILPISVVVALGWREVLHPLQGWITGMLAGVLAIAIAVTSLANGNLDEWTVLVIGFYALVLLLQPLLLGGHDLPNMGWLPAVYHQFMQQSWVASLAAILRPLAWASPFLMLWLLNLLIPWLFILPQL